MAYSYYQQAQPGWGTNQYQFGRPPTPNFVAQPSWGGRDFYSAHAISPDPSLFDNTWNRVRDYRGIQSDMGIGMHEARHWHHRAYAGVGQLNHLSAAEIGHAAAYEAFRAWIHHSSLREPLSGDIERQREGLVGLAVAEASRLLQFTNRAMDHYARTTASEAAAHTASLLFYQHRDEAVDEYRPRRSHYRNHSSGSYEDPYAYDDEFAHGRRHRSHSHHRSHSRHRTPSISYPGQVGGGGYPQMTGGAYPGAGYASSMPIPSVPGSNYSSNSYGSAGPAVPMPMPIHGTPYPSSGVAMNASGSYPNSSMPMVVPVNSSHHHRNRSNSMSYPQNPYAGQAMSAGAMIPGVPQPQVIVVSKPRRHKHNHHHHHDRSKRSRSIDRF